MINSKLKERWEILTQKLSTDFRDGDDIDLDSIIYLIGVQELQQIHSKFNKNQKLDLMHIAICKLLSDYGYYKFDYIDEQGWPHYKCLKQIPNLKAGEQSILMKDAIVNYFLKSKYIQ
jgi:hypothetical protein